jgi:hypothetical protein
MGLKNNWQTMIIFLLAATALPFCGTAQEQISPYLIGQNAWEKKSIFKVKDKIGAVHYHAIRIGGNNYERGEFFSRSAIELIDFVRAVGAEPIVQVPRQLKDGNQAYQAVKWLNGMMKKRIRLWSIGNEPDHKNQRATDEEVRDYFMKISEQIKRYDPQAIVMGFDLSSYKIPILNRLLGGDLDVTGKVPGKDYYYLDQVSFHNYKFSDISGMEANVKDLKARLAALNASRPSDQQIGWAITEFNSHWKVDPTLGEDFQPYTFHNGQIYAEMYDLGMREGAFTICPWSILEGGAKRQGTDLSMFDLQEGKYLPRSNYYHTQLLAIHLKKNYLKHSPNPEDLVVVPTGDKSGIAVMVMNKSKWSDRAYQLSLTFSGQGSEGSPIQINAAVAKSYNGNIPASATQMLVFDIEGNLIRKYSYSSRDAAEMRGPHQDIHE